VARLDLVAATGTLYDATDAAEATTAVVGVTVLLVGPHFLPKGEYVAGLDLNLAAAVTGALYCAVEEDKVIELPAPLALSPEAGANAMELELVFGAHFLPNGE
jgi:hypothetical protein